MITRFWSIDALTGTAIGDLPAVSGSFSQRFGGGTCELTVPVGHLKVRGGQDLDYGAIRRLLAMIEPGKRSVAVTVGTTILGEWLITKKPEPAPENTITISGMEWDGYPALRSLHASYEYKTATDQLTIAKKLLDDAFKGWQDAFQISIPTATSGVRRTAKWRTREHYYSDALDEISLPQDGFDWRVTHNGTWDGPRLTRLNRSIIFGSPVISRNTSIQAVMTGPGSRAGNTLRFETSTDMRRYLHSVYAFGAGQGAKQLFYEEADDTLSHQGYVKITKNLSFPDITSPAALQALAHAELLAGQNLREPFTVELLADKLPALPRLGDKLTADISPNATLPDGYTGTIRIGGVDIKTRGNRFDTVEVLAA